MILVTRESQEVDVFCAVYFDWLMKLEVWSARSKQVTAQNNQTHGATRNELLSAGTLRSNCGLTHGTATLDKI